VFGWRSSLELTSGSPGWLQLSVCRIPCSDRNSPGRCQGISRFYKALNLMSAEENARSAECRVRSSSFRSPCHLNWVTKWDISQISEYLHFCSKPSCIKPPLRSGSPQNLRDFRNRQFVKASISLNPKFMALTQIEKYQQIATFLHSLDPFQKSATKLPLPS
jgi:hypothetical protein